MALNGTGPLVCGFFDSMVLSVIFLMAVLTFSLSSLFYCKNTVYNKIHIICLNRDFVKVTVPV